MIQDEDLWNKLYAAADAIYKFCDPEHGFDSGTKKLEDGSVIHTYNLFYGANFKLENKLKRKLTKYEQAVLAIAVGDRGQKCLRDVLDRADIDLIFQELWNDQPNREHVCLTFEHLVTSI